MFSISQRTMLMAAVLAAMTGGAFAQSVDRAQVRAEAAAAVKSGLIARGELSQADLQPVSITSERTRAEVRSETLAAMAAGQIPHGELGAPEPRFESTRTRAEVNAETRMAMQLDLIPRGEAPLPFAAPYEVERIRVAGVNARSLGRQPAQP